MAFSPEFFGRVAPLAFEPFWSGDSWMDRRCVLLPVSLEQFLDRLTDSSLMSKADVETILESLSAQGKAKDGEQLARELVRLKKLTAYQAQLIYKGQGEGLVLGNYLIQDKLGQGGMGMVLKAKHKRMHRLVAIKVLVPAAMKSPDAVQRFHREVEAAAQLEHPNIVTAHDADEAHGTHFLVMQYVEGKTCPKSSRTMGRYQSTRRSVVSYKPHEDWNTRTARA